MTIFPAIQNEVTRMKSFVLYGGLTVLPAAILGFFISQPEFWIALTFPSIAATNFFVFYLNSYFIGENRERLLVMKPVTRKELVLFRITMISLHMFALGLIFAVFSGAMQLFIENFRYVWLLKMLLNCTSGLIAFCAYLIVFIDLQLIIKEKVSTFGAILGHTLTGSVQATTILLITTGWLGFQPFRNWLIELFHSWWFSLFSITAIALMLLLDLYLITIRSSFDDINKDSFSAKLKARV